MHSSVRPSVCDAATAQPGITGHTVPLLLLLRMPSSTWSRTPYASSYPCDTPIENQRAIVVPRPDCDSLAPRRRRSLGRGVGGSIREGFDDAEDPEGPVWKVI